MTTVTNVDGTYVATNPHDHCRHGVYVGGCGYDFTCHACEMGDPDLTLRQAQTIVDSAAREMWAFWDAMMAATAGDPLDLHDELEAIMDNGDLPVTRALARAVRQRDAIASVATGPDDDQYLVRAHRAEAAAWDRYLIAVALEEGYTRVRRGFLAGSATPEGPRRLTFLTFADVERLDDYLNHRY